MSCYLKGKGGQLSFCINVDERDMRPIILDPLLPPDSPTPEFDLLGRSVDVEKALGRTGHSQLTLDIFKFVEDNSTIIGFVLPMIVPLMHYGIKLVTLVVTKFFFFADIHRILMGPMWRSVFRLPKDPAMHPSYAMYIYCCDLLCISCPEPEEFFHPDNYAQFMRLAYLINPMRFSIINRNYLNQQIAASMAGPRGGEFLPESMYPGRRKKAKPKESNPSSTTSSTMSTKSDSRPTESTGSSKT